MPPVPCWVSRLPLEGGIPEKQAGGGAVMFPAPPGAADGRASAAKARAGSSPCRCAGPRLGSPGLICPVCVRACPRAKRLPW